MPPPTPSPPAITFPSAAALNVLKHDAHDEVHRARIGASDNFAEGQHGDRVHAIQVVIVRYVRLRGGQARAGVGVRCRDARLRRPMSWADGGC